MEKPRRRRIATQRYNSRDASCLTCRARRVKCEGRRPACERCARNGTKCGGYDSFVINIDPAQTFEVERDPIQDVQSSSSAHEDQDDMLMTINSPPAIRRQLQEEIAATYLCKSLGSHWLFEWYWQISPRSQALTLALDAWALLNPARRYQDTHLLQQGTILHGKAISRLISELSVANPDMDTFVAAAHIIQNLESITAGADAFRWRMHAKALTPVMMRLAREAPDVGPRTAALENYRYFGLWDALLSRKRMADFQSTAQPAGTGNSLAAGGEGSDWQGSQVRLSTQVPGILEDVDCLLAELNVSAPRVAQVLSRINELEVSIAQWRASYYADRPEEEARRCFPLSPQTENTILPGPPFSWAFKNTRSVLTHYVLWTSLLYLSRARWEVLAFFKSIPQVWLVYDQQLIQVEKLCDDYADSLYASLIPFLSSDEGGSMKLAVPPLHHAYLYYEKYQKVEGLRWCLVAERLLESKGRRLGLAEVDVPDDDHTALEA